MKMFFKFLIKQLFLSKKFQALPFKNILKIIFFFFKFKNHQKISKFNIFNDFFETNI